jgi:DNA repair protein RecO (recombination protein O)
VTKTQAIVLKAIKFRESSVILTLYTEDHGKISAIVKGARRPKGISGTALQPMAHIALILYEKKTRDIQTAAQLEAVKRYPRIDSDLNKMHVGMAMVELVRNIAHDQEKNARLFNLLADSLAALDKATESEINLLYIFELHLAHILGYRPAFSSCISCKKAIARFSAGNGAQFFIGKGGPWCGECRQPRDGHSTPVTVDALRILNNFSREDKLLNVLTVKIGRELSREIDSLLWLFLQYHVTGIKPLRSKKIFSQILEDNFLPAGG